MSLPEQMQQINIRDGDEDVKVERDAEEKVTVDEEDVGSKGEFNAASKKEYKEASDLESNPSDNKENSKIEGEIENVKEKKVFDNENKQSWWRKKGIVRKDLKLPKDFDKKLAFVLYNVFTEEECKEYIRKTEEMGYELALVNVGGGRLRFLRYDPGEYFKPHMDGMYIRDNGERSYITVQLYLNEGFKGGSTTFMDFDLKHRKEVVPKAGMVLVFDHEIMHEGSELIKGRKYSMRTDIMYSA